MEKPDNSKSYTTRSMEETKLLGQKLGRNLQGGELFVMESDLGGGKTTFVKGLASGMGIEDTVQSPTFTLAQIYESPRGLSLHHYDFYRLNDPGVMKMQLAESLQEPGTIVAVEWSGIVKELLHDAILINFANDPDDADVRLITISVPKNKEYVIEGAE